MCISLSAVLLPINYWNTSAQTHYYYYYYEKKLQPNGSYIVYGMLKLFNIAADSDEYQNSICVQGLLSNSISKVESEG